MVFKSTKIVPIDRSGVFKLRVFHLYGGSKRKVSGIGDFVKGSAISVKPENWIKKKSKLNGIIVRVRKESYKLDGSAIKFKFNCTVLLKKRLTPKGKELFGPIDFSVKRRKFVSSFSGKI
jgi:large subunit ribosomal protein L14